MDDKLLIAHRVEIGRLRRVVPAAAPQLRRVDVEDVENVACRGAAELDAEGMHQDQLRRPPAPRDSHFRRKPAAEGKSEQREFVVWQLVEDSEIEMDEIVDRIEIRRPLRIAKPR